REWRLDNLYFIQNERGEVVRFVRNESQHAFWDNAWYLNAILKARQLGFSTLMALLELDTCLFNSNISAGIVDYSLVDAKKKLAKVAFAYQRLPAWLRQRVPTVKDSTTEIAFENTRRSAGKSAPTKCCVNIRPYPMRRSTVRSK